MTENEFRKVMLDPSARRQMKLPLNDAQARDVAADDAMLQRWYDWCGAANLVRVFQAPPPAPPRQPMSSFVKFLLAFPVLLVIAGGIGYLNSTYQSAPDRATAGCSAAMSAAANVVALDNGVELRATLDECGSAADWIAAIKDYPGAGSLVSYTTDDAEYFLDLVCVESIAAHVCIDASAQGILTYELDDPRLIEMNH